MTLSELPFVSGGCRCRGILCIPTNWTRPQSLPTIVVVPGGKGLRSEAKEGDCGFGLLELAKSLVQEGFAAVCYDGRGQGQAEGKRMGHDLAIEDLQEALGYIRSCDVVDPKRIGLLGQSVGGAAAVLVAERDPEISSLILWGTLPRYSVLKTETDDRAVSVRKAWGKAAGNKSFEEFVRDFKVFDPVDHIGNLCQPILLAGGSDDTEFFRHEEQAQLFLAAKQSARVMRLEVKGEIHRMRHWSPPFPVVARMFAAWFRETM